MRKKLLITSSNNTTISNIFKYNLQVPGQQSQKTGYGKFIKQFKHEKNEPRIQLRRRDNNLIM